MKQESVSIDEMRGALIEIPVKTQRVGGGHTAWTDEVKRTLIKLGHDHGWQVWTSYKGTDVKADDIEFLWDLCWGMSEQRNGYLSFTRLGLVVECEWTTRPKHILEDFQKLLCANASTKLFIWRGHPELLDYMKDNIKLWDEPPKSYLFANYRPSEPAFQFEIV